MKVSELQVAEREIADNEIILAVECDGAIPDIELRDSDMVQFKDPVILYRKIDSRTNMKAQYKKYYIIGNRVKANDLEITL